MALVRIYQKPAGTPANGSVFAIEVLQNNIWYTRKVSWEALKGLIAGAESLVLDDGKLVFTTPDGVAHEVLTVEDEVLAGSDNPVSSGAVSSALNGKQDVLTFDQVPTDGSTNPVESNGIYDALAGKQDTLTFDTAPTDGSTNPVTSAGIYAAISAVTTGLDWKDSVPTYADIATTYPNPQDGWSVTTLDDDRTYRYNGTAWVDLFSLITLATDQKDGLMSSTDFSKLAGIEAQANRTIVDDALSTSSTNPVQNKVITGKLNTLLDVTETAFTNPYTKKLVPSGKFTEKLRKIVGATVNWNQLLQEVSGTYWVGNDATETFANGVCSFTASAQTGRVSNRSNYRFRMIANHKYYCCISIKSASNYSARIRMFSGVKDADVNTTTSWQTFGYAITYNSDIASSVFYVGDMHESDFVEIQFKNFMVFDLTAMFNASIANRFYTLEQAEAGSGIAWLQSYGFFLNPYYAYNAGSIQSVSLAEKKNRGKNIMSPLIKGIGLNSTTGAETVSNTSATTDYIPIDFYTFKSFYISGLTNTLTSFINIYNKNKVSLGRTSGSARQYMRFDIDSFIGGTPQGTGDIAYIRVVQYESQGSTGTIDDVDGLTPQIEIGSAATAYAPYVEPSITPLDHTDLRGFFKLDANNNIYADGDEYTPDGAEAVKYEDADLGNLTFTTTTWGAYKTDISSIKSPADIDTLPNALAEKYTLTTYRDLRNNTPAESFAISQGSLYIVSTTSPAGKSLYEKATPTAATLTPYDKLQNIESGGTEEFIDYGVSQGTRDVAIPVGNESVYGDNENMGKIINYMQS